MLPQDLRQLAYDLDLIAPMAPRRVLLLTPSLEQFLLIKGLLPEATVFCANYRAWDLNKARSWQFDLIFSGNVMMMSPDPLKWFDNVLPCTRLFLMQEPVNRSRGRDHLYFGSDGDAVRFAFGSRNVTSAAPVQFDLDAVPAQCLASTHYQVADCKGSLADQISVLFQGRLGSSRPLLPLTRAERLSLLHCELQFIARRAVRSAQAAIAHCLAEGRSTAS